jgi:glycerophosphoryl diester phosphodiesterase
LDSAIPTGLLLNVTWVRRSAENAFIRSMNIQTLHISRRLARPRYLKRIRRAGLRIFVWGANHPAELGRLVEFGVDGIITDAPQALNDILQRTIS